MQINNGQFEAPCVFRSYYVFDVRIFIDLDEKYRSTHYYLGFWHEITHTVLPQRVD